MFNFFSVNPVNQNMGTCFSPHSSNKLRIPSEEEIIRSDEEDSINTGNDPKVMRTLDKQLISFDSKLIQLSLCYPKRKRITVN